MAVASNKADAGGLQLASAAHIPTFACDRSSENPPLAVAEQKERLWRWISEQRPDLVLLAGYMQIVPPKWIRALPRRILNIHPALLPALPGLDTHKRALEGHHSRHGATVHLVDDGVDTGEIIAQAGLDVAPQESEESLAARVLALEHRLYPWVVNQIAAGTIALTHPICFNDSAKSLAAVERFTLGDVDGTDRSG